MFNIGIRVDADNFTTETQAVVSDLQQVLNKNGITVPVELNNATLKEMDQFIQSIGGSMKITKDALTGFIENISVNVPKANGQILSLNQGVQAVSSTVTNLSGVTQQVFSHFETTDITTTMNGMNTSLERAKELQSDILKLYKQRVDLEHQMATALVQGDSKQQASLQAKLTKNESLDGMYREQLAYLQQQANAQGVQINLWDKINTTASQIDGNTASWTRTLTQSGQDAIALAQNLNQSKKVLNDFANTYQRAMSTDGTKGQMLTQDLNNMRAQVDAVINAMTNLGATVDSTGAHYQGNITAVQDLCNEYNKITRQLQEFNAQKQDQQDDKQKIEQTVQAYKAYRDQLDRINELKKKNATGVDMKAEQQQLDALKTSYKNLEQQTLSNGEAVYKNTQYNRDKNQITRDSIQAQKELNVTLQDNSLQNLIADTIMYKLSLQSLLEVIKSVVSETLSLNDSMTQIRLVTQGSAESTKALMSDYSEIAKQLGTTTSAVAESATEWLRQGNTVEETSELVKASTTLSVIGAMQASDATTALTASLNGYNMEAKDAMKIVDQLTTLDLRYATSSGDIATAMSKVASSASQAGVPLERMEAIITVTADQTQQAAETIGRAWNSILQRMNKISAGKDISDTGMALNDVDKALKTVRISLRDENGIIKDSAGLLDEIAAKWDTWNRNQQNQISTAVAGTNQANVFRATISDYKEVLEATTIAENANGSATERMAIYTESLTAKINKFKTTWIGLVNDLNLDSLIGLVVDLGTELLEVLNLLLNKIPVLSTALKGIITAQGINILAGGIIKAIQRVTGTEGIRGLLSGLVNLETKIPVVGIAVQDLGGELSAFASLVGGEFTAAFTAAGGGLSGFIAGLGALKTAALTLVGPVGVAIAVASAFGVAAYAAYKNIFSLEARMSKAQDEVDKANKNLDETNSEIDELNSQIQEINDKDSLTYTDQKELDNLNEQLDVLKEIKKTQEEIAKTKNDALLSTKQEEFSGKYSSSDTVDNYQQGFKIFGNYGAVQNSSDINELIGAYKQLNVEKQGLVVTNTKLAESEGNNADEIKNNNAQYENYSHIQDIIKTNLLEQKSSILQDMAVLQQLGDTSSDVYKDMQAQLDMINSILDPQEFEKKLIDRVVDTDKVQSQLDEFKSQVDGTAKYVTGTVNGVLGEIPDRTDEIMQQTIDGALEKIMADSKLRDAAEQAFGIDLSTLDGYIRLKEILSNDIPQAFSTAIDAANGVGNTLTTNAALVTQYASDVEELAEKQKILNTAYTEMKSSGELTYSTVQSLIKQAPELANAIEIQDGKMRINVNTLRDLSDQYYDTKIASYESQIEMTGITVEQATQRVKAYEVEMNAIAKLRAEMLKKDQENWDANDWAQWRGMQQTEYYYNKEYADDLNVYNLQKEIDALNKLKQKGLSYTSKGTGTGTGTKTDPEKEAYDLKKSELGVLQDQLELQKSILEQSKKEKEQKKKGLEIQKSELELQKQEKEQQLEIIKDAEDGIDDIIELIKKMTKQDYENLKTKLTEVKDYIGDFKDALDDVKDTYDGIVDDAKDKLKAEKEAVDNQKKLEDGAKSIAEIQAQLAEIQYDDSADAQAKRLELTASLNEKQQDLEDEMKDQAYNAATDALDKTKDKVDNIFDAIGDILDASQDVIEDYVNYISDTLESEGNLYKAAVEQFNDTSEGAREELQNRLLAWNNEYGSSIDKDVTEPWNKAVEAVEKYKEAVGSADIDSIRQWLGNKDIDINASIKLDEQKIDGLDNQIDQIKIDMDKVDQTITQFEQAITQVKNALKQLDIDYNKKENAESAGTTDPTKTGTEYAYSLMQKLLKESGVDTSELPATWQEFVNALNVVTETATNTGEALDDLGDQAKQTGTQVEQEGDAHQEAAPKVDEATQKVEQTEPPMEELEQSAQGAAGALSGVEQAATTGSTGSKFDIGKAAQFLIGGNWNDFVQNFATKAISKYLPKLIKAGIGMIGKLHDGTDEVKKSNSWLDKMLGLGQDETARILKVGEAVVPDYANDAIQNMDSTAIHPTVTAPNTSNIKTTNNSELNIDMGDLDISGIDTTELRNELESIKKESANQVYSTLYRYIKVGGYRNVRNRYN